MVHRQLEVWLEAERDQLPLWLPVMLLLGVAAWFLMPHVVQWQATLLVALSVAAGGLALGHGGRAGRVLTIAGLAVATGMALIWWQAERVAEPVLARPAIVRLRATVERVEPLPARDLVRLRLATIATVPQPGAESSAKAPALPPHVRVNVQTADLPPGIGRGAQVVLGARLMPPVPPAVPGAYDFAQVAWFQRLGATGRAQAPITVLRPAPPGGGSWRERLTRHIETSVGGSAGGVAAAFVTGDVGAISDDDSNAMRRAGLAHLLSISGLHITAAVAGAMLLTIRLLALFPWLALRVRLPLIAGGVGAFAAIGYTLLSGAEVPTVRSCVAALLVLAALAIGREAMTLRLVAAGATVVLLLWPDSAEGPSFQLSFAAVTAIVALHEHPRVRGWFAKQDEPWWRGLLRHGASLLLTGLVVELALMPIAVYHFHRAGLYGAIANIVAIPLSTFAVMPAEAAALLFDPLGLGAPFWWVAGKAIALLLWIARVTAAAPGATTVLPTMPIGAFELMVAGGLWIALWRTRLRRLGLVPLAIGAGWALMTPAPDLLVTGDGEHALVRTAAGLAILRDRAGDYTRDMLMLNAGDDGAPLLLAEQPDARCSRDACLATLKRSGRQWRILATRSGYMLPIDQLVQACRASDIVISDRALPRTCQPSWLAITPALLRRTGGLAITLTDAGVRTVNTPGDEHPWARAGAAAVSHTGARYRRGGPARGHRWGGSAGGGRHDWRDRAGSSRLHDGNT